MSTYNEFENRNLDIEEQLVKRYFWFLVDEFNFKYGNYSFSSEKIHIEIQVGHKLPSIFINRIGEPEYMKLLLDRILQHFEGSVTDENIDYTLRSLADNIIYYADKFRNYSHKLIDEIDDWWIPVQVFQYRLLEQQYTKAGQLKDFLTGFKRDLDYLKSKSAL